MRLLLLPMLCATLGAHKYHYSRTEINWDTKAAVLEVVATLHADDVEAYLQKRWNRRIELDRDRDAEALVCRYAGEVLEMPRVRLRCLGMKVGRHFVDLFLEGKLEDGRTPEWLRNRILTDELPEQRNDVELKRDGRLLGPRVIFTAAKTKHGLRW